MAEMSDYQEALAEADKRIEELESALAKEKESHKASLKGDASSIAAKDKLIAELTYALSVQPEGREHEFEIVGMWDGSTARWTAYEPVTGDYLFRPRRPQHDRLKDRRTIMCPVDGACDDDQCRLTQKCQKRHYAAEESRKEMK
jgi:hypothetical protein